eukprot:8062635-Pyramimonas_sp.AAC.1
MGLGRLTGSPKELKSPRPTLRHQVKPRRLRSSSSCTVFLFGPAWKTKGRYGKESGRHRINHMPYSSLSKEEYQ